MLKRIKYGYVSMSFLPFSRFEIYIICMNVYRTSLEEDQQDRPLQGAKDAKDARRWIPGFPF